MPQPDRHRHPIFPLRMAREERAVIAKAARLSGKSLTRFIVDAAVRVARVVKRPG